MTHEPKDFDLYHNPSCEADQEFKHKTARNVYRKFGKTSDGTAFSQVPVNLTMWEVFMNSCVLAVVHLSEDEVQFQHVLRYMEMEVIGTMFINVRMTIHGKCIALWIRDSTNDSSQTCTSAVIRSFVLVENVLPIHNQWQNGRTRSNLTLPRQKNREVDDLADDSVSFARHGPAPHRDQDVWWRTNSKWSRTSSRIESSSYQCTTMEERKSKTSVFVILHVYLLTQSCFNPDVGHSLVRRTKKLQWKLHLKWTMEQYRRHDDEKTRREWTSCMSLLESLTVMTWKVEATE